MSSRKNLTLIKNNLSHDQRIQAKIDSFRREIMQSEGDMQYVQEILEICLQYVSEYDDNDVYMSSIKIKEAIFYLDCFISGE